MIMERLTINVLTESSPLYEVGEWADNEEATTKLGQVEDLMEKYGIKDLAELERVILANGTGEQAFKEFYEQNVKPYKDIEQELGIKLSVLVKALKNGAYLKHKHEDGTTYISQGIVHLVKETFGNNLTLCCGYKYPTHYRLEDYGKTWALTKEELEK